jgi:hypothetical protein
LKVEGITSKNWKLKELHLKIENWRSVNIRQFIMLNTPPTVKERVYTLNMVKCFTNSTVQAKWIFLTYLIHIWTTGYSSGISTGDGTHYFYPTTTVTNTGYKWLLFVWCSLPLFCLVNCTLLHKNRGDAVLKKYIYSFIKIDCS